MIRKSKRLCGSISRRAHGPTGPKCPGEAPRCAFSVRKMGQSLPTGRTLGCTGIGLPGHFICRYQSSAAEFYVDVFQRGTFLTKADCVQYLLRGNHSVREQYLTPVSPRRILLRICSNLHQIYEQLDSPDEATRVQRYVVALAK